MDNANYFEESFESIPDYRKIILLKFLNKGDKNLLKEVEFSEYSISRLNLEFKKILLEQHEEFLDYVKSEEKSIVEKLLNK